MIVKDRFVYTLNANGENRFEFQVQPGKADDGQRTPDAECEQIARDLAHRYNTQPDLLAALESMVHAWDNRDLADQYDTNQKKRISRDDASMAMELRHIGQTAVETARTAINNAKETNHAK